MSKVTGPIDAARDASPKPSGRRRQTELHRAATEGDLKAVRTLLNTAPELLNVRNKDGATALHLAIEHGRIDVARLLVASKAGLELADDRQWTPLHLAAKLGNAQAVDLLLRHDANVKVKDAEGRTPRDLALQGDHKDLADRIGRR